MPEYDFNLSMNETIIIKAKDKYKAKEEAEKLMRYKFFNQLDGMEAKER